MNYDKVQTQIYKKKIKIMRIITRLNIGGPSIHAILLTKGLNNERFESLLTIGTNEKKEGYMDYLAKERDVHMNTIPELQRDINLRNDIIAFYKILKLVRKYKPHIIHTHMAKAGIMGRVAGLITGVPVRIHTFHGHIFHSYFGWLWTKIFILIEKIMAKFTDRIIVVSKCIKNELCERFRISDANRTTVIDLGLDLDLYLDIDRLRGRFRNSFGVSSDIVLVGCVGRLTPIKNHKLLFEAIYVLKRKYKLSTAKFLLFGDGELKELLQHYAELLDICELVSFLGWHKDMAMVYADLDIVVLSSLNEGTPLSLIEAMAAKRPVVATAVGGVPDIIENDKSGLLVSNMDANEFADSIFKLIRNEELRTKMGLYGHSYVFKRFAKERLISDIEGLYQQLINTKRSRKR